MFFTYILQSKKNGRWYTGYTADLRNRLKQHHEGKFGYTKHRGPYEIIYYEACRNENDARAREKYLKTTMGKRFIKNRLKRFLTLMG